MQAIAHQVILNWILLTSLNVSATFLTTDYLQNAYVITSQNSLVKIDSAGTILFTYNQNRFGQLKFADATNPLKLILSYPDYQTVVMLDNTLSEVGTISLKQLGIYNYHALCFSSRDNNFWVFDENDFKLKKIDRNSNIILESSDMFQQLGYAIHPVYMQEENQYLFVSDTTRGILIFDIYGVYYETLPFKNILKFQARNDQIFFQEENHLHSFQMKSLAETDIAFPEVTDVLEARMENRRLYLLKNDSLKIYKF
ncbi:MAG TPA: hypothetical protein VE978_18325 [Chitinophagales bacterium]|nr:hypothetical protein [Chitinophagales bacterium]